MGTIRNSEADYLLQALFSRILDPLVLFRLAKTEDNPIEELYYIDLNPSYEKVMQINRELVIGRSFREVSSESESGIRDFLFQVGKSGEESRYEGYSAEVGLYLHWLAFSPLPSFVAVFVTDMTAWKAAEEELQTYRWRLAEHRRKLRRLETDFSALELQKEEPVKPQVASPHVLDFLVQELRSLAGFNHKDNTWNTLKIRLDSTLDKVENLLQDTRSFELEASSPLLKEIGLEAALKFLAEKMLVPYGIALDFSESGPQAFLSMGSRLLIYGMTRELLMNVLLHAEASEVAIRVMRGRKRIRVLVEDDGCGFSVDRKNHWGQWRGLGLFSIRERLRLLGGNLRILTEKGQGSSIWLTVPVITEEDAVHRFPSPSGPSQMIQESKEKFRKYPSIKIDPDEEEEEDKITMTTFE